MAASAALALEDARTIAGHYGLRVLRVDRVEGGRVNSNFRLWTRAASAWKCRPADREYRSRPAHDPGSVGGLTQLGAATIPTFQGEWRTRPGPSFFVRVYEQRCESAVQEELRLVRELARAGVPTPSPVARVDGGWACEYSGKPVALFPWVHGGWVCQRSVTPELCHAVGVALARLHEASRVCRRAPPDRYGLQELRRRLDVVSATGTHELASAAATVRRKLEAYAATRDRALPSGITHGDLFRENVLWDGDRVTAMVDFECACHGPFVYDLMVCVLAWCYRSSFDWPLVRGMIAGYAAHRAVSLREIRALPVEGAWACLRFATTRISDFSIRAGPEGPKRDYRRFLRRLAELEAGASEELTEIAIEIRRAREKLAEQQEQEP